MGLYEFLHYNVEQATSEVCAKRGKTPESCDLNDDLFLFEYKPAQCQPSPSHFVRGFRDAGVHKFVFLYRQNYLRRYVSYLISRKTGIWHQTLDNPPLEKVRIPIRACSDHDIGLALGDLVMLMDYYYKFLVPRYRAEMQKSGNYLELVYEDDIEHDVSVGYSKLVDFLDLNPEVPMASPSITRQNPYPLSDLIENYDEIVSYLNGSSYLQYLVD